MKITSKNYIISQINEKNQHDFGDCKLINMRDNNSLLNVFGIH